ncbi:hypothetical protein [Leptospira harrisiae]|uniref:hypothetical protein n=1 Tax=Leptospira harrisiae TaxID=2023189 RepID=UPI000C29DEB3|nr:hypothetical protein [Leptospira harrisiae]PKA06496.1 hypothetical protein CH366_18805 [Leptospira harrisiae]
MNDKLEKIANKIVELFSGQRRLDLLQGLIAALTASFIAGYFNRPSSDIDKDEINGFCKQIAESKVQIDEKNFNILYSSYDRTIKGKLSVYGKNNILQDCLVNLMKTKDDSNYESLMKIHEIILTNEKFSTLPEPEGELLNSLSNSVKNNENINTERNIEKLTQALIVRYKEYSDSKNLSYWSLIIGIFGTVFGFFSFISIIKEFFTKK